jgi:hypothetical protein
VANWNRNTISSIKIMHFFHLQCLISITYLTFRSLYCLSVLTQRYIFLVLFLFNKIMNHDWKNVLNLHYLFRFHSLWLTFQNFIYKCWCDNLWMILFFIISYKPTNSLSLKVLLNLSIIYSKSSTLSVLYQRKSYKFCQILWCSLLNHSIFIFILHNQIIKCLIFIFLDFTGWSFILL